MYINVYWGWQIYAQRVVSSFGCFLACLQVGQTSIIDTLQESNLFHVAMKMIRYEFHCLLSRCINLSPTYPSLFLYLSSSRIPSFSTQPFQSKRLFSSVFILGTLILYCDTSADSVDLGRTMPGRRVGVRVLLVHVDFVLLLMVLVVVAILPVIIVEALLLYNNNKQTKRVLAQRLLLFFTSHTLHVPLFRC